MAGGFDYVGVGAPTFPGPQAQPTEYFDKVGRVLYVWDGLTGRWIPEVGLNSTLDNVTALGTNAATATVIPTPCPTAINITSMAAGTGIILPTSWTGAEIAVNNNTSTLTGLVYPQGTETINALGAGAGFVMGTANFVYIFYCFTQGKWFTK